VKLALIKVAERLVNMDDSLGVFVDVLIFEQAEKAEDQRE
jgi:hypothetical protein